jgi:hypothetical protein
MKPKRVTDNNLEQKETRYSSITRTKSFTLEDFLNFRESHNTLNVSTFFVYLDNIKNNKKK